MRASARVRHSEGGQLTTIELPRRASTSVYPVRIDAVPGGEYVWRITAANGRSIARSAITFPSPAAAVGALDRLIAHGASRPLSGTVGHRPGGWGWTVTDEQGRPVAHSPRTFERHGSCARSLQLFRSALAALLPA